MDLFLPSGAVVARPTAVRDAQSILQCGPHGALLHATTIRDAGDGLACAWKPASNDSSNLFDKPGMISPDLRGT